jgi:hypothetical protein
MPGLRDTAVVYALKALRFGVTYGALALTSTILVNYYNAQVLGKSNPPPWLMLFVPIWMAVDLGFNLVLLALAYMAALLFGFFPTGDVVLAAADYGASWLFNVIAMALIANEIYTSAFTDYTTQGQRAIRMLANIMLYVNVPLFLSPLYLIAAGFMEPVD